jgi:hypothetical protein
MRELHIVRFFDEPLKFAVSLEQPRLVAQIVASALLALSMVRLGNEFFEFNGTTAVGSKIIPFQP